MKSPSPSAIIGQRDAQTGDARATRARQLATPSWLSTRPKAGHPPARGARLRCSRNRCENSVINLELATTAESSRFFSLALLAGAAMTQDDFGDNATARRRAHCRYGRIGTARPRSVALLR